MMYLCSIHVFRIGHKKSQPIASGSSGGKVPISGASKYRKQSTTETSLTASPTTADSITTDIGSDMQFECELHTREHFFENWIFDKIFAVKSYDFFLLIKICVKCVVTQQTTILDNTLQP